MPDTIQAYRKGTTGQVSYGPDNMLTLNAWNFVGVYFPTIGTAPSMYHGTLTSLVANVTEQGGVGGATLADDSAFKCYVGASEGATSSQYRGTIAFAAVWNGQVTLSQLQVIQFNPFAAQSVGDCRLLIFPGLHGASTIPDLSGNANNGTVTNASLSSVHLPINIAPGSDVAVPYVITVGAATGFMTTNIFYW